MAPFIDSPPPPPPPRPQQPQPPPPQRTPDSFSQPRPRAPRSPEQAARVRVQNRRREYLERNPAYFASGEHELADPLLYDALIRRFQSPAEREAEGRAKGYSRVLEGSLLRGEARLQRMAASYVDGGAPPPHLVEPARGLDEAEGEGEEVPPTLFAVDSSLAPPPKDKAAGQQQWTSFLRDRFVAGRDADFDYGAVDGDEDLDVLERREAEDAWFEDEEEAWVSSSGEGSSGRPGAGASGNRAGETGVQDF